LVSYGHCIVSPSLIYGLLITPLVSYGHYIVSPSVIVLSVLL
jgi:diphthamide synthase subunit DPH2